MTTSALHLIIAKASALLEQLEKTVHKKEADKLRQTARELITDLDTGHPKQSAVQQALALTRELANSTNQDFGALRHQANVLNLALANTDTSIHKTHEPPSSSRQLESWMLDMLRYTESAIPRETLLEDFVNRYRKERNIKDFEHNINVQKQKTTVPKKENTQKKREESKNEKPKPPPPPYLGPWLFVFETESVQQEITAVRGILSAGVHPEAFAERCREHLVHWQDDVFLKRVIIDRQDIDGWYALPFVGGSALFDALIDTQKLMKGESDYWLSAAHLSSDGRNEARAVFILYRNFGDTLYPEPPAGLRLDMRLLTVLSLVWRQLEHQVKALARLSEADRRDMINLIAPGLMHHEIGITMRTAYGQAYQQYFLLKGIVQETERDDVFLALRYAQGIAGLAAKLYRITDVFNNLDKRTQIEDSDLDNMMSDVRLLLQHRLGSAHTDLAWDADLFKAQILSTDVVLLSHALINLINNAINALSEADTPAPCRIQIQLEHQDSKKIGLIIINNGPVIPPDKRQDIFKRGVTTRPQGHGQGLYLARLVAHYLGGELNLMPSEALPEGFYTGFRFSLLRHLPTNEGL